MRRPPESGPVRKPLGLFVPAVRSSQETCYSRGVGAGKKRLAAPPADRLHGIPFDIQRSTCRRAFQLNGVASGADVLHWWSEITAAFKDFLVVHAVAANASARANSLLTGKITGTISKLGRFCRKSKRKGSN